MALGVGKYVTHLRALVSGRPVNFRIELKV